MTKSQSLIILLILLITACTTTITKTKDPVFNSSTDSLGVSLAKLVVCEDINLDGKEITVNGKINSALEIDVINGRGIPKDEDQMMALGKKIATTIKDALKDKAEYQTYKVLFVTKTVSSGITQRTWTGKEFKTEEL